MDIRKLPKIELHVHLDCSLSYKVVSQIDPSISFETYKYRFVGPSQCSNLAEFLTYAQASISLMQTAENLRLVVLDLFEQLVNDNIIYAEIRFAPLEHIKDGLSDFEVVKAVNDAISEGNQKYDITVRMILSTLRHYDENSSMKTIELVQKFMGTNVVGFDIASDEAGYPIDNHIKAFEYAHENNIPCTAHAGEAKGPESIRETLKYFRPQRIGHGVRCAENEALMDEIKEKQLHLEICPTSNIQTGIYHNLTHHTINKIYEHGISCGVNTDNRTISDTNLTKEYEKLIETFEWSKEDLLKCNLEALDHAFINAEEKQSLKQLLIKAY